MHALLDYAAARYGTSICIEDETTSLTYNDVGRQSRRIANGLRAAGILRDEHAAILSLNHPHAFVAALGCMRAGVPPLPLNPMAVVAEVTDLVVRNDVRWLFFHSHFASIVEALRAQATPLAGAVCLDAQCAGYPSLQTWLETASDRFSERGLAPDDIACMFTSGGTTGAPKGVETRLRALNTMVASFVTCMPHDERPVYLAATPISHGAVALAWSFLAHGVRIILLRKPEPELVLNTIERERISMLFLPPTAIYNLLATPGLERHDYSSLDYFLYAGAPMSTDRLCQAIDVFGPVMCQSFGQAEAPIICTYLSPDAHLDASRRPDRNRMQSCGRATPFTEVAIFGEDGVPMGAGEIGEIVVRGDLVMAGYYANAAATAEVSQFGWHHTGDLGYQDEEGYFYVVDRKRDMIISGGFNVFPSEIERRLLAYPGVRECVVIGVPHSKWGEAIKAVVELEPGARVDAETLTCFVRDELGSLKTPKSLEFWPQLPRSSVGKVLRKEVRTHFWSGEKRRI